LSSLILPEEEVTGSKESFTRYQFAFSQMPKDHITPKLVIMRHPRGIGPGNDGTNRLPFEPYVLLLVEIWGRLKLVGTFVDFYRQMCEESYGLRITFYRRRIPLGSSGRSTSTETAFDLLLAEGQGCRRLLSANVGRHRLFLRNNVGDTRAR
jgi:hypothetical protein